jgi:hypothetical protein
MIGEGTGADINQSSSDQQSMNFYSAISSNRDDPYHLLRSLQEPGRKKHKGGFDYSVPNPMSTIGVATAT